MFSSAKAWWNPVFVSPFKVLVNVALPLKGQCSWKGCTLEECYACTSGRVCHASWRVSCPLLAIVAVVLNLFMIVHVISIATTSFSSRWFRARSMSSLTRISNLIFDSKSVFPSKVSSSCRPKTLPPCHVCNKSRKLSIGPFWAVLYLTHRTHLTPGIKSYKGSLRTGLAMFAAPVYRRNYRQRGTHVVSAEQEMGWGHVFLSRIW